MINHNSYRVAHTLQVTSTSGKRASAALENEDINTRKLCPSSGSRPDLATRRPLEQRIYETTAAESVRIRESLQVKSLHAKSSSQILNYFPLYSLFLQIRPKCQQNAKNGRLLFVLR